MIRVAGDVIPCDADRVEYHRDTDTKIASVLTVNMHPSVCTL